MSVSSPGGGSVPGPGEKPAGLPPQNSAELIEIHRVVASPTNPMWHSIFGRGCQVTVRGMERDRSEAMEDGIVPLPVFGTLYPVYYTTEAGAANSKLATGGLTSDKVMAGQQEGMLRIGEAVSLVRPLDSDYGLRAAFTHIKNEVRVSRTAEKVARETGDQDFDFMGQAHRQPLGSFLDNLERGVLVVDHEAFVGTGGQSDHLSDMVLLDDKEPIIVAIHVDTESGRTRLAAPEEEPGKQETRVGTLSVGPSSLYHDGSVDYSRTDWQVTGPSSSEPYSRAAGFLLRSSGRIEPNVSRVAASVEIDQTVLGLLTGTDPSQAGNVRSIRS